WSSGDCDFISTPSPGCVEEEQLKKSFLSRWFADRSPVRAAHHESLFAIRTPGRPTTSLLLPEIQTGCSRVFTVVKYNFSSCDLQHLPVFSLFSEAFTGRFEFGNTPRAT